MVTRNEDTVSAMRDVETLAGICRWRLTGVSIEGELPISTEAEPFDLLRALCEGSIEVRGRWLGIAAYRVVPVRAHHGIGDYRGKAAVVGPSKTTETVPSIGQI